MDAGDRLDTAADKDPTASRGGDPGNDESHGGEGGERAAEGSPAPDLAEVIARAVRAHPGVVRLDGGRFGEIVSLLPGRKVVGVRAGIPGAGVEVGVVLRLGPPIPDVVGQLRALVRELAGPVPVDIAVTDVAADGP